MRKMMTLALAVVIGAQGIVRGQTGASESYRERYSANAAKKMDTVALVDINRASVPELTKLPGMTKVWADRVVKFRPYKRKTELLENGILPDRVYDKIKDFVIAHRTE